MDELEIDGKKYLSSRRAAKEHKYHTDYIGQLIRAGKIEGKKVGRAWYVEEVSLNAYLKSEKEAGVISVVASQPVAAAVIPNTEEPIAEEIIEETIAEESPIVEERIEIRAEPLVEEKPEQKIHITLAERNIPQRKNTLTYIEDTEPFIPELGGRQRANADFTPVRRPAPMETAAAEEAVAEEMVEQEIKVKTPHRFARTPMLAVVAIITLVVFAGVSSMLATSIQVSEGQPASVAWTIK